MKKIVLCQTIVTALILGMFFLPLLFKVPDEFIGRFIPPVFTALFVVTIAFFFVILSIFKTGKTFDVIGAISMIINATTIAILSVIFVIGCFHAINIGINIKVIGVLLAVTALSIGVFYFMITILIGRTVTTSLGVSRKMVVCSITIHLAIVTVLMLVGEMNYF